MDDNTGLTDIEAIAGVSVEEIIVFRTLDMVEYEPIFPKDVPREIKDPECVGRMLRGLTAQLPDDPYIWIAVTKSNFEKAKRELN